MSYIVLMRFADLQDGNHIYEAGDTYPRPGHVATDQRVAELAGSNNKVGRPLIKANETPKKAAETSIEATQGEGEEILTEAPQTPMKANSARLKAHSKGREK